MYSQSTLFGENLTLIQFGVRHEKDLEKISILDQLHQKFSLHQKFPQVK